MIALVKPYLGGIYISIRLLHPIFGGYGHWLVSQVKLYEKSQFFKNNGPKVGIKMDQNFCKIDQAPKAHIRYVSSIIQVSFPYTL